MKKPEKKNEWITYKTKPTIEELEKILNDEGYETMPSGELRVKDKEAIGYNRACDDWENYHKKSIQAIISEVEKEIASRPQYPNIGKRGCIKRLRQLIDS